MGLFKKKVVRDIHDCIWGHLLNEHEINVDTLTKEMRCVEREGAIDGDKPVTFVHVFRQKDVAEKGIEVTGWETFDQHPDLILFEGYLTKENKAFLERKKDSKYMIEPQKLT